ncbi:hypothetical protein HMN09_00288300 [Mycena chlorophos]|uniref:Uncharacterized protein n=1 Tax=Mycena chlorophos TaxID=658473 RepID=A0A8H6TPM4_MYCCL|nr:hypothetical protein HMN09_00288300 [Mycena chlorophos]
MEDPDELSKREAQRRRQRERRLKQAQALVDLGIVTQEQVDEGWDSDDEMESGTAGGKKPGEGESRREMSWIWTMAGKTGSDEHFREALRIEWSKAWARTRRWREERRYLAEEWRRLPLSLQYEEQLWSKRAREVNLEKVGDEMAEGMQAYAFKQAAIYRDVAQRAERAKTEDWGGRGHRRGQVIAEDRAEGREDGVDDDGLGQKTVDGEAGRSGLMGEADGEDAFGADWEDLDSDADGDYSESGTDGEDESESDNTDSDLEDEDV